MSDISNKWRKWAVMQILSNWTGDALDVFNALYDANDEYQTDQVFAKYDIIVWQPFEHWSNNDVADYIADLAREAWNCEKEA